MSTPGSIEEVPSPTPKVRTKSKRFSYTPAWDLLLLKAVTSSRAHLSEHGEATKLYGESLEMMLKAAPQETFVRIKKPVWKSVRDRYKKISEEHAEKMKMSKPLSGVTEERGEREVLLDDLILEKKEHDEQRRSDAAKSTQKEARLIKAGEAIRALATSRQNAEPGLNRSSPSPTASKKRPSHALYESDKDEKEELKAELAHRRDFEAKRIRIDEERLAFEKQKDIDMKRTAEKAQLLAERKLAIEEKKAELEIEERKQQMEERSGMLDVLKMFAKKLNE